jgi:hypothetical protein
MLMRSDDRLTIRQHARAPPTTLHNGKLHISHAFALQRKSVRASMGYRSASRTRSGARRATAVATRFAIGVPIGSSSSYGTALGYGVVNAGCIVGTSAGPMRARRCVR